MAQRRTIARFEDWRRVPENIEALFGLLEGSARVNYQTFRDACHELRVPYLLAYRLVNGDPVLRGRYESILAARADAMANEALEIADRVEPERGAVAKAKLQVDTRQMLASRWDRERYGERIQVEKSVNVSVDVGLLGKAAELLQVAGGGRLIEGETLTLPAPKKKAEAGDEAGDA
jgi:hypothetical protein